MPKQKKHILMKRKNVAKATDSRHNVAVTSQSTTTTDPAQPSTSPAPSSSKKRKSYVLDEETEIESKDRSHILIQTEHLKEIVSNMVCSVCYSDKVDVKFTQHQIDTYITVKCECGKIVLDTHASS